MKNFIITIIAGIIIGLVVPTTQKFLFPDTQFEYQVEGPLNIGSLQAAKVSIRNNGAKPEKNVRIIFNISYSWDQKNNIEENVILYPNTFKAEKEQDKIIVTVGDLRPGEEQSLSVLSRAIDLNKYSIDNEVRGITIKSNEYLAKQVYTSEWQEFVYPITFWLTILSFVALIAGGIYYDYFIPFPKKEKMLQKQLAELRKKEKAKSP